MLTLAAITLLLAYASRNTGKASGSVSPLIKTDPSKVPIGAGLMGKLPGTLAAGAVAGSTGQPGAGYKPTGGVKPGTSVQGSAAAPANTAPMLAARPPGATLTAPPASQTPSPAARPSGAGLYGSIGQVANVPLTSPMSNPYGAGGGYPKPLGYPAGQAPIPVTQPVPVSPVPPPRDPAMPAASLPYRGTIR